MLASLFALNQIDLVAEGWGALFGAGRDDVKGVGRARATRDGTTLRYGFLHFVAKPPNQEVSPVGLNVRQEDIIAAMGKSDRGLVKVGAQAIEQQLAFTEPSLALSAIGAWIIKFLAVIEEGRQLAKQLAREDVTTNPDVIGWRQSRSWQAILAMGRTLRLREPDLERDDEWDEQEEEDIRREQERDAARKQALRKASQERHATARAAALRSQAAAQTITDSLAKARATRADPMLASSQAALDAVRRDPALKTLIGPLEVAGPGFVALSGKVGLVRAERALRGGGLTVSLFFKAATKAARKEVRAALSRLFPACPISDHDYGEGKTSCTRVDALIPAGA